MQTLELDTTITGQQVVRISRTQAVREEALSEATHVEKTPQIQSESRRSNADGWRRAINEPLIDWGNDPSQLEDEGIDAPTREIVTLASRVAMAFRDIGKLAPDKVVPCGDGGIVFKRSVGDYMETIEIGADRSIEIIAFQGTKIVDRIPVEIVDPNSVQ